MEKGADDKPSWQPLPKLASLVMVLGVLGMLGLYVMHCIHASSDMYSSPSIVLVTQQKWVGLQVLFGSGVWLRRAS